MTFCANTGAFAVAALIELQRLVSPAGFLIPSPFDILHGNLQAQPK